MQPNLIHKNIRITGRVQGVGFRYSARQAARELGITGYVKNLPDGSVYIEAEATPETLERFLSWCHQGPSRAIIKHVSIIDGSVQHFPDFRIN